MLKKLFMTPRQVERTSEALHTAEELLDFVALPPFAGPPADASPVQVAQEVPEAVHDAQQAYQPYQQQVCGGIGALLSLNADNGQPPTHSTWPAWPWMACMCGSRDVAMMMNC
jgi:hypothetical protein